jgi:hypothetical protein
MTGTRRQDEVPSSSSAGHGTLVKFIGMPTKLHCGHRRRCCPAIAFAAVKTLAIAQGAQRTGCGHQELSL